LFADLKELKFIDNGLCKSGQHKTLVLQRDQPVVSGSPCLSKIMINRFHIFDNILIYGFINKKIQKDHLLGYPLKFWKCFLICKYILIKIDSVINIICKSVLAV
jgi:hypothetical protein